MVFINITNNFESFYIPHLHTLFHIIDNIINYIENLDVLKRGQLYKFKRGMEKLRNSNDKLRDSGIYWYEEIKKLLTK